MSPSVLFSCKVCLMHHQLLHAVYCHQKIKSMTGKQIKNQDSYFLGHVRVDDLWGSLQSASGRSSATCWFRSARGEANLAQGIKGVIIFRVVLTLLFAESVWRARVSEWRATEERAGACAVCGTLTDWDAGIMCSRSGSIAAAPRVAPAPRATRPAHPRPPRETHSGRIGEWTDKSLAVDPTPSLAFYVPLV